MANLKARDLEGVLKAHGEIKGILMILTHIIERLNDVEQGMTTLANVVERQTDLMNNFMTVAGNMKEVIEKYEMKKGMEQ